jgi:hypothetical protein
MTTNTEPPLIPIERIAEAIHLLRGQRVLLDSDLAALYGVSTKHFNQQVKRNLARFPTDFTFQVSDEEAESLRSQFVTLENGGRGRHRKYLPYAFTEHGVIMASMILNGPRAVAVSVYVVRAFVQLRSLLASHTELERKVTKLERGQDSHGSAIVGILKTIQEMKAVPQTRAIGFVELEEKK